MLRARRAIARVVPVRPAPIMAMWGGLWVVFGGVVDRVIVVCAVVVVVAERGVLIVVGCCYQWLSGEFWR